MEDDVPARTDNLKDALCPTQRLPRNRKLGRALSLVPRSRSASGSPAFVTSGLPAWRQKRLGSVGEGVLDFADQMRPGSEITGDRDRHRDRRDRHGRRRRDPAPEAHLGLPEHVSDAVDGMDEPASPLGLELAAQIPDVHAQRVPGWTEVIAPDTVVNQLR
jgi:hypothetical protein